MSIDERRFVRPDHAATLLGISTTALYKLLKPICPDCGAAVDLTYDSHPRPGGTPDRRPRTECQGCGSKQPGTPPLQSIRAGRRRLIPLSALDDYCDRLLGVAGPQAS